MGRIAIAALTVLLTFVPLVVLRPPGVSAQEGPTCSSPAKLPPGIMFEPVTEDVDPQLATYLGAWEGSWDGINPAIMAVTRVGAADAQIVYVFAGDARVSRRPATLSADGVLQWRYADVADAGVYTFKLADDLQSIVGAWDWNGRTRQIQMTRCTPGAAPQPAPKPAAPPKPAAGPYVPPGGPPCPLMEAYPPVAPSNGRPHSENLRAAPLGTAPEIAALIGGWGGTANDGVEIRLVVAFYNAPNVRLVVVQSFWPQEYGWTTPVQPGPILSFSDPTGSTYSFAMMPDLESLEYASDDRRFGHRTAVLTRCSLT